MQLGMIGLGRMGANMARRLRSKDIAVVGYNREPEVTRALARETGLKTADNLGQLVELLTPPRAIWLMLPAGEVTQQHIDMLIPRLMPGDLIVDGANSYYRDSIRRAADLARRQLHFVDAGVSGGIWGRTNGYALMVGGDPGAVEHIAPVLKALAPAPDRGWLRCGPVGTGHFVKMVHNGIEYGMMQAYAEGFALLKSHADMQLDVAAIAEAWRHGSVVQSWLLDIIAEFLAGDRELSEVAASVADSGEGRWTVIEAVEQGIPTPVISMALMMRFASQGKSDYAARLLAMMRQGFGGHPLGHPKKDT